MLMNGQVCYPVVSPPGVQKCFPAFRYLALSSTCPCARSSAHAGLQVQSFASEKARELFLNRIAVQRQMISAHARVTHPRALDEETLGVGKRLEVCCRWTFGVASGTKPAVDNVFLLHTG